MLVMKQLFKVNNKDTRTTCINVPLVSLVVTLKGYRSQVCHIFRTP